MRNRLTRWMFLLLFTLPGILLAQEASSDYRDFDAVKQQLESWAREHPQRLELENIGSSAGGAGILVARVADKGETEPDKRPAVFVGANIVGYHNAGTEAALHLIETLLGDGEELTKLLGEKTFYIAPVLNPDAHGGFFATPKHRLSGNDTKIDRDVDGLFGEDGPNDLNNDGRITWIRIPDPQGDMLPDPDEPRVLIKADRMKGQRGEYKLIMEGNDDDGDGQLNEDGPGGMEPARNFAHAYEFNKPETGPWPGYLPESKALMDFLLARRNVAVAVVYGPANHLLAIPRGFGGGGDLGTMKFKPPQRMAQFMGLDPEQEYTLDEVWEVVKDSPMVAQMNVTKDQLAQFMGAGAATKPNDDDLGYIQKLAESYKERLEKAGLDNQRPAKQSVHGGLAPWLYYQYGAMAIELDVWGIPKAKKADAKDEGEALTVDRMAEMSSEEFLALKDETIDAFLKGLGAPPQMTAAGLKQRIESGQVSPAQMAQMARRMGGGGGGDSASAVDSAAKDEGTSNDVMAFIDEHAPDAFVPWAAVTLPDGSSAEVGGVDPFIEIAPPYSLLEPALKVHTETILEMATKLAQLQIVDQKVESLGSGIYRITAVAANRGFFPTHTKLAQRAKSHLPVRLEMTPSEGVEIVTGPRWLTSEGLDGETGTLEGEWLVRVSGKNRQVTVEVFSDNAGHDLATISIEAGS